jgi:hypothetical protein
MEGDRWLNGEKGGYVGRWVTKLGKVVAKLLAHLLSTAALLVRIRTSLKNTNGET